MANLLSLNYYFALYPGYDFRYTKLTLALILLLFLAGIALKIYRRKYVKDPVVKKMIKAYPSRLFSIAGILLLLLTGREANIPFLSMRIWWLALLVYFVWWIAKTALHFKKDYHHRLAQANHHVSAGKWLPKKKGK